MTSHLKIYYHNVGGLRTRLTDFRLAAISSDNDIIVIVESSLNESFFDGEVALPGYQVFRKDRGSSTSSKSRGGGVLM